VKFLDTNIFLRYLTRDDPAKADACRDLLARIDRGEEDGFTTESAIVEVIYVLQSPKQYALPREEIVQRLDAIFAMENLRIPMRAVLVKACQLYGLHPALDLADALAIAHMQRAGITEIYSYDRDFDRIPGITRIEP
jgi:predicted nucleic acid-binding protein